ncbi:hypothetical protein BJX63DRAFT_332348 [Aspergillus granulosus]|uniref:Uncharacterized protein n=1 Tax=Aspergillus granulosus TaxID=176169 RepID=A0ABR4H3W7_9EURO
MKFLGVYWEAGEPCGFGGIHIPGNAENLNYKHYHQQRRLRNLNDVAHGTCNINPTIPEEARSSITPSCYGRCATFATGMDYYLQSPPLG